MEAALVPRDGYDLGSRIPLQARDAMDTATPARTSGYLMASRIMGRASTTSSSPKDPSQCGPNDNTGVCEKPVSSQNLTIPIVLGTVIPILAMVSVLLYLHRRHKKKLRREDAADPYKAMDFGLGENVRSGGGKRKSTMTREKPTRQLSMEMDLSSPYLLPAGLQGSRESLHSLARTLQQKEDPYRPIAYYAGSDAGSARSMLRKEEGSSTHSGSSKGYESGYHTQTSKFGRAPTPLGPDNFTRSPREPEPIHRKPAPPLSQASTAVSPVVSPSSSHHDHVGYAEPAAHKLNSPPYPSDDTAMPKIPIIQEPPIAAQRNMRSPPQASQTPPQGGLDFDYQDRNQSHNQSTRQLGPKHQQDLSSSSNGYDQVQSGSRSPPALSPPPVTPAVQASSNAPRSDHVSQHSGAMPVVDETVDYYDYDHQYDDQYYDEYEEVGQHGYEHSASFEQKNTQGGLEVPHQDSKRLSVGFRPLPPDDLTGTEDPETRANRIRSFYKEYFDDTKADPLPVAPQWGNQPQYGYQEQQWGGEQPGYYDDNYANYNYPSESTYYDPDSNAFVMPYSEPVTRRAMTPPPSGSRFPGPRGPRGHHGSMGGMSLPGGRYGPPRPGSSASNPHAGSMMSGGWGRSRAGSTMSGSTLSGGRMGRPRKQMPPPAALSTLPNPSKLRDDSFALMGAIDFAPPETYKDHAAGRSQSPAGERRPYKLQVPIHSPLVNSFEELPSLPSPHTLRKSSTFTGLDFAPPRKFAEANDARSETGSIRSNRSGMSMSQLSAIRGGAGRVSRLPGDTIFTQVQMPQKLKPQWGMRD